MNKKPIGFTQEDKLTKVEEPKKKSPFKRVALAGAIVLFAGWRLTVMFGDEEVTPVKETTPKVEQVQEETKKDQPEKEVQPSKPVVEEWGQPKLDIYGEQLMGVFNAEINSTKENIIFRSSFSYADAYTLIMKVDITNVMNISGSSEGVVELGITQGAEAYKPYLQRFNNRIWNGKGAGLVLKVQNLQGKTITEVTL